MLTVEKNGGKMASSSRQVDKFGNIEYCNKKDQIHREDGPAVIRADGTQYWFKNGKCHRDDGPAVIYPDGTQCWLKNDKYHREDGPAVIRADGSREWYKNGKRTVINKQILKYIYLKIKNKLLK